MFWVTEYFRLPAFDVQAFFTCCTGKDTVQRWAWSNFQIQSDVEGLLNVSLPAIDPGRKVGILANQNAQIDWLDPFALTTMSRSVLVALFLVPLMGCKNPTQSVSTLANGPPAAPTSVSESHPPTMKSSSAE